MSSQPESSQKKPRTLVDGSTLFVLALVLAGAGFVLVRDGWPGVLHILAEDSWLFLDILPKVLAGCLIGAFVAAVLPREFVSRWIGGDSGVTGLVIATAVGAIMPGGPFTIYPLAGALLAVGAGVGPAVAFVTSWTLIGLNRAIIWEAPFLGVDFVTTRMLVSLPLPIVAGLLAHWLARIVPGGPR
ncbi:permease [Phreatobacter cathodiphilus]|uniref:Permease n=1 Tax=Phreatobacter cathodiphilus TaxID=1868589 RepID=A0A2S0ND51_9HYPH|nr:permease [Phreatobacter cathodiphilus]AVO46092.1 permease [Phreatobacter cathodiphilus]